MRDWEYVNPNGRIVVCAWCQSEQGVKPTMDQSHGICPKHYQQVTGHAPDTRATQPQPEAEGEKTA